MTCSTCQVAEMVGTKSRDKCKNHYTTHYLESDKSPLPDVGKIVAVVSHLICFLLPATPMCKGFIHSSPSPAHSNPCMTIFR